MAELVNRRQALVGAAAGIAALRLSETATLAATQGQVKQSVCRWCYGSIPLAELAAEARRLGYRSVELLDPKDVPTVKAQGLTCAMFVSSVFHYTVGSLGKVSHQINGQFFLPAGRP